MGWLTPKTDWEIKPLVDGLYQGDWFNAVDYNRIANNLRYLHVAGQNIYDVEFDIPGIMDQSVTAFPHASDMNALEDALYAIATNTYSPDSYTGKATWTGNGATPTVADLNRIELACEAIYAHYNSTPLSRFLTSVGENFLLSDGSTYMVR